MDEQRILDIAEECIICYPASEAWSFTTAELQQFVAKIIDEDRKNPAERALTQFFGL